MKMWEESAASVRNLKNGEISTKSKMDTMVMIAAARNVENLREREGIRN